MAPTQDAFTNEPEVLTLGCVSATVQLPGTGWGVGVSCWAQRDLWEYTWVSGATKPAWAPCVYYSAAFDRRWRISCQGDVILMNEQPKMAVMFSSAFMAEFDLTKSIFVRAGGMNFSLIHSSKGAALAAPFLPAVGLGWQFYPPAYGKHLKMKPIKGCKP